MKIFNNNEKFGDAGPFEAESFETLADEMMPVLEEWAKEELDNFDDAVLHDGADQEDRPSFSDLLQNLRDDFIAGLSQDEDEAVRQPAWAEYKAVRQPALAKYEAVRQPAEE